MLLAFRRSLTSCYKVLCERRSIEARALFEFEPVRSAICVDPASIVEIAPYSSRWATYL